MLVLEGCDTKKKVFKKKKQSILVTISSSRLNITSTVCSVAQNLRIYQNSKFILQNDMSRPVKFATAEDAYNVIL